MEMLISEMMWFMFNSQIRKLYSQETIQNRVADLAIEIETIDFDVVMCILKGAVFFFFDLVRQFKKEYPFEFILASSYIGTKSGPVDIHYDSFENISGKRILLLDDIADTGKTISVVSEKLLGQDAETITTCCLLNRVRANSVQLEFCGFEIATSEFLVGYGLDMGGNYRSLPYIGII